MIEIQNLTKTYGQIKAVNNISFTVEKGEILGFLGPNGAGKSTTMNIITGFIPSTEGTVKVDGYDIMENPKEVKKRIGYLPELPPLYMDMTVQEYLNFLSELKGVDKTKKKSQISDIMELVKITDVRKRLIKNLSKGYKQRVGLAQALIGNPEVLILDEPTVGLDPKQIIEIRKLIKALGKEHTIILSSHILPEVSAVCERVVIINKGEIAAIDTPENLSKGFGTSAQFSIRIAGPKNSVLNLLKGVYGVKSVDVHPLKENDVNDYIVDSSKEVDVRRPIFYELAKHGYPILELKSLALSLEDIFLQLTTEEKEVG
ncbi:ABC transporter [Clostridium thermosuccinogenes]|jgi:ABC-2 type transport system ATP-binding protein|uniref:ABC transporter n=1 Tax=Clostridium thermosuccinogenes TaxID=84032 RepID=A0A2K2FH81_9CLOT|nr:ATP-binding cassette domain-containing protein [Pseudoclostridium thermosuccinogenes]AUS97759.1 ABC transporter [Pseudoclostridium thermosuccinogenes]PNT94001.1 ABC transporter [Pseudoclostridium thermosuccinogenes]PNT98123.1 ABC transporter [Pseudoclostridium thermosuccinogenes]PNU00094.1 ABC transporter [Pseudoclostridium thermosuccinogenes]